MTAAGPYRLPQGGRIDRSRSLRCTFDGRPLTGHPGDTLASALLAAGVRTVARSIQRGRPRGIVAAGVEEPNALVQVESGAGEPMRKATEVELCDGLAARALHGKGVLPAAPDTARYDHRQRHCDVLVVGAGPAGLAAALAAGQAGARVMLLDDGPEPGGDLLGSRATLGGAPALSWVTRTAGALAACAEATILPRTTAVGYYDHNYLVAVERRTDHLGAAAPPQRSRQRLWHVRARRVVLATGAHERPLVFTDNDLPGVMLAAAARVYVNRFGVAPGRRAVVATTNDSAYEAALDLLDAGIEVVAVVDARPRAPAVARLLRDRGVEVVAGAAVSAALGDGQVVGARIHAFDGNGATVGRPRDLDCDLLAVSGGWNPAVHLFSQSQGRLRFDDLLACFVPDVSAQPEQSVGAASGRFGLSAAIAEGAAAGAAAARAAGFTPGPLPPAPADGAGVTSPPSTAWVTTVGQSGADLRDDEDRQFVDLQRDATVADIRRAASAGLTSVEHVKRYTTIGTANDQGKTSGTLANGVLAAALGVPVSALGTTTYRPPYVPVTFALLAGRNRGALLEPTRTTSLHPWHVARGAVFEAVGQWLRPWYFPQPGEDLEASVLRECRAAREGVAAMDASTLGKIDLRGRDAGTFLDRIYTNAFSTLAVGSCRYGVMCRADGMVLDDGVTARLGPDHFHLTTTTGGAATVLDWLEEWLQTEWPGLEVLATSVTEQWATVAVVGPRARAVLQALAPELDLDAAAFPFMTWRDTTVAGIPARVFRISFSGELAYEVNVAWWHGLALWEAVMAAGEPHGITPYGTEAMHVLRAEKGYPIVGQDTDGTVTPVDLGMDWVLSKTKPFVGKRSLRRPDTARGDRKQLVGLLTVDPDERLPEGAQLVADPSAPPPVPMLGHVTSSYHSAVLGRTFALALVEGGRDRAGERLWAPLPGRNVAVEVTTPGPYDPQGARRDG